MPLFYMYTDTSICASVHMFRDQRDLASDPSFSICCCRTLSKAGTYCIQSAQHVVDTQNTVIIIQHINTLKLSLRRNYHPIGSSAGKESACNAGDLGSIPGLGRSPGEGNDYPLQYSGLENSMEEKVHGVSKSQTQLSN